MFNFFEKALQASVKDVERNLPSEELLLNGCSPRAAKNAPCKGHILLLGFDRANKMANNPPCETNTN